MTAEIIISGGVFVLLIFFVEMQFINMWKRIKDLEDKVIEIEKCYNELKSKMWSEEKLTGTIDKTVTAALNAWMLDQVERGNINIGRRN